MARIANPSVFRAEAVMIDWNAVANTQREAGGQGGLRDDVIKVQDQPLVGVSES